jgi:hypothetical protein
VGLVDRAEAAGVVRREPDPDDGRVVRVRLTGIGDHLVTELTKAHLAELYKLADALNGLLPDQHRRSGELRQGRLVERGDPGRGPDRGPAIPAATRACFPYSRPSMS